MKVLFLGNPTSDIANFLREEEEVIAINSKIDLAQVNEIHPEIIISYGYPYLVSKDILDQYEGRAVNLHISYLPWNRGSDPEIWSILEDTPKGVTIHLMNEKFDEGDILIQELVMVDATMSLSDYYHYLHTEIRRIFIENWPLIKGGFIIPQPQPDGGTYHRQTDKVYFLDSLKPEVMIGEILGEAK